MIEPDGYDLTISSYFLSSTHTFFTSLTELHSIYNIIIINDMIFDLTSFL